MAGPARPRQRMQPIGEQLKMIAEKHQVTIHDVLAWAEDIVKVCGTPNVGTITPFEAKVALAITMLVNMKKAEEDKQNEKQNEKLIIIR